MRRRTPSEIKAYGDGYSESYKEFCHLLKKHDVDKAIRRMEIFVKAVEITVETATDEPNLSEIPTGSEPQTERHLPDYSYEADLGRRIMEQTERSK